MSDHMEIKTITDAPFCPVCRKSDLWNSEYGDCARGCNKLNKNLRVESFYPNTKEQTVLEKFRSHQKAEKLRQQENAQIEIRKEQIKAYHNIAVELAEKLFDISQTSLQSLSEEEINKLLNVEFPREVSEILPQLRKAKSKAFWSLCAKEVISVFILLGASWYLAKMSYTVYSGTVALTIVFLFIYTLVTLFMGRKLNLDPLRIKANLDSLSSSSKTLKLAQEFLKLDAVLKADEKELSCLDFHKASSEEKFSKW